jgi:predicted AAA+ superfamily ATPase
MIPRTRLLDHLKSALRRSPAVCLLGPRQSGKTTLARALLTPESQNYFDLERPASLRRLENPETSLGELRGLVVVDEVQRRPDLFPILRVLIDRPRSLARVLLLGSASPVLLRQSFESLAGRIEVIEMTGFSVEEVGQIHAARLWLRGGFPRSYVAGSEPRSFTWREEFIRTFLEQDLPQLGIRVPSPQLNRFWIMLAHYHGQIWNAAEPASSLGLSQPTVRSYLDLMTSAYMIRRLQPWHENLSKRQVKAPKIYVRDSGLLHTLLGLRKRRDLLTHPKLGASWEGFVIEQLLRTVEPDQAYFWATHQGAEIDLLMLRGSRRVGVEIKRGDAPSLTPSMRIALEDLRLSKLWIIYPGELRYNLNDRVTAIPFDAAIAMKRVEFL